MKRKPIKREVRCIYTALLKNSKMLNLRKMIGFYEEYDKFRKRVHNSEEAPMALKNYLPPLKMPKYLMWAKKYLVKAKGKRK
jgi:hypothetical protein